MPGIVIDRLVGYQQLRGCSQRFAAAGISGEAWMRAAGDLQVVFVRLVLIVPQGNHHISGYIEEEAKVFFELIPA